MRHNAEVTRSYFQPPDPVVVYNCDCCGAEIYEGETCYEIPGRYNPVCGECINEVMREAFDDMDFADRLDTVDGTIKTAELSEEW